MDSDAFIGSKCRNTETQETPLPSSSLAAITTQQDSRELSETISSPKEGQEATETSPKKKPKCFILETDCNFGENQYSASDSEMGFGSGSADSQELLKATSKKTSLCDSTSGSFGRNAQNLGEQLHETGSKQMGFVDVADKECFLSDFSLQKGKKDDLNAEVGFPGAQEFDIQDNAEVSGKYNAVDVKLGSETEGDSKESLATSSLVFDESKVAIKGKDIEPQCLLEAEKKRLLAELEVGRIFNCKGDVENVTGFQETRIGVQKGSEKIAITEGMDLPVSRSLKFHVIDDTALIESVPMVISKKESVPMEISRSANTNSTEKNAKQEVDGKKPKRSRRKAKNVQKTLGTSEGHVSPLSIVGGRTCGGSTKIMYSREEMEVLRFSKIVEQRKLWKYIYTGLGAAVMKEYDSLASSKQQKNVCLNFDPTHLERRKVARGILRDDYFGNDDDELEYTEVCETKNINTLDDACTHGTEDEDDFMFVEGEYSGDDDSDEDYDSILKPALSVEGEPNFDSGPPEDGLEYLRRVRWEAAQIPKVKVAKLEKSKTNKEQSIYMPQIPEIAKCSEQLMPLKEWEDVFLDEFSELRKVLSHQDPTANNKLQPMLGVQKNDLCQFPESIIVEKLSNLSTDEVHTCQQSHPNPCVETSSGDGSSDYPTLSAIQKMDSVARVSMLRKRITAVETMNTLSRNECVWLFALCAAIDTPLDADTCASMRSLLRKCASLRAGKSEVDDEVVMLNMLATISGRYFGQSEA